MGIYIDPVGMTKVDWLREHAREVPAEQWSDWGQRPSGEVPLCVFCEPWPAILVCYFRGEIQRALPRGSDQRARTYYYAPIDAVVQVLGDGFVPAVRMDAEDGYVRDAIDFDAEGQL